MSFILQINSTLNWGSTGKIAEQIGLSAQSHGWASYMAYGRYSNPSKNRHIRVGSQFNVYEHYIENILLDKEGLSSRHSTAKFIKELDGLKPDIVHLHNIHDHYLNYKLLFEYLNKTNIKVVWTFHDCWAFTGHCYHFVNADCLRWQTECRDCPLGNRFRDRSNDNFLLKKSLFVENKNLTIVSCSEWMAGLVRRSFLKEKNIKVIHNGVDLNVFKPSIKRVNDGKFKILAVSSVWPKSKGLADIISLKGKLSQECEITIVGLNKRQIKALPDGIVGIQRTQSVEELVQRYSNSDVLINTSYADTFPTVNLEALACGTPVITYRTGGSPESIDEKTGIVVDQGDVDALASAIYNLKANPLRRKDCRKRAEECFDKNKCFEEYVRLYESLLSQ